MEEKKHIRECIVDYLLSGEKEVADPVLLDWLSQDDKNVQELDRYRRIWIESGRYVNPDIFDVDCGWARIDAYNKRKMHHRMRISSLCYALTGVAATILLMVALSVTGAFERNEDTIVSLTTDYGSRSEIALPDGSIVKLNAGSNITYKYNSKEKIREVQFQGEGYFDVSKSGTPFVVQTHDNVTIKVLGTSFNLKAYDGDPTIQTSLVEGCVVLEHDGNQLSMKPGEVAEYDRRDNTLKQVNGDLSHSYGWLNNKLYMDDMSLGDVCKHLERRYNVDIHIQKDLSEGIRYNGVIQEETIADVLDALSQLSNIAYQMKGRNISITPK